MLQRKGIGSVILSMMLFWSTSSFAQQSQAISPIPAPPKSNPEKIAFGRQLYMSTLFSQNNSLSCNSCHNLIKGGADNLPKYIGLDKKVGLYNTPTVLNSSLNFRQFWDGRAKTLEDVIDDHLKDPTIFNNDWPTVIKRIKSDKALSQKYKKIYKGDITEKNLKNALVTYLGSLLTLDSPFDRYLKGDLSALSEDAKKGYQLFKSYGCITCHQGPNVGGNIFEKFGIYKDYFATRGKITKGDLGLYNVTKQEEDKYVFKVPSLRNVALTAPYLHDGSADTLEEVIQLMGIYQVGQPIQSYDVPMIVKFLESLTGMLPESERTE